MDTRPRSESNRNQSRVNPLKLIRRQTLNFEKGDRGGHPTAPSIKMAKKFELDCINGDIVIYYEELKILVDVLNTCKSRFCDNPNDPLWEQVNEVLTELSGEIEGQDRAEKQWEAGKPQIRHCGACCKDTVHRPDDERGLICYTCEPEMSWWGNRYEFQINALQRTLNGGEGV